MRQEGGVACKYPSVKRFQLHLLPSAFQMMPVAGSETETESTQKSAVIGWFIGVLVALGITAALLRLRTPPVVTTLSFPADTSLGTPNTGFHTWHIGGVAMLDFLATLLLSMLLAYISNGPFTAWLVVTLIVAEIMHFFFGIRTATQRWLFFGYDDLKPP